jgi:Outer membrane protein (OmpH-like).
MRKILFILMALVSLSASAQSDTVAAKVPVLKIGFLSYDRALKAMPDYVLTQQRLANLRADYDKELKRVEDDFNRKYEEFLDGQKDFPKTILYKRQTELKELMERNVVFKANSRRELAEAERAAMEPLRQQLNGLLAQIAKEHGYALILNTDADACPYIDPLMGEDINQLVHDALQ